MIRFVVKNKNLTYAFILDNEYPVIRKFVVDNRPLKHLFVLRNRFFTDLVFLMDENNFLLLDENGRALVD